MKRLAGSLLLVCPVTACLIGMSQAATVTLRNHSYVPGGSLGVVAGFQELDTFAARFVAAPGDYPFKIKKVRTLAIGSSSSISWIMDIWQDANTGSPAPDTQIYAGDDLYAIHDGFNEFDLSGENIMITSGGVRVGLTYVSGGAPPSVGIDLDGIVAQRNFVRPDSSSWSFAESPVFGIGGDFIMELEIETPGIPGDYNDDGTVDAADYVMWRNGGPLANEVNAPGTVNAADYTAWRARFGNPGSGAGAGAIAAVPEPANAWLLIVGALLATWRGSRIASHVTSNR
jgi:hypothetical protein